MLKFIKGFLFAGFFVVSVVLSAGCGSSSGSVACTFTDPEAATFDLNGTWTFTITSFTFTDPDCSATAPDSGAATITVTGNTVVVTFADDPDFRLEGQVSGSEVILGGSQTEEGETLTIDCTVMPVTAGGDTITFSAVISISGDEFTCDGTADGTITR